MSINALRSVLVLGAGGLGAAYGAALHQHAPGTVAFRADGDRADRLERDGVIVNGTSYKLPVQRSDTASPVDLILLTVKYHHLAEAVKLMRPCIGPHTLILSLLNGIDSEEFLAQQFPPEQILHGMSLGIDAVRVGNSVSCSSLGKIYFGRAVNTPPSPEVRAVQQLFDAAGISYETPPDMLRTLWWKWMINVGINQVSTVLQMPYKAFQDNPHAHSLMEAAMREVIILAQQRGIDLSENDIVKWNQVLQGLDPTGKTSMLQDFEGRRKTEVEMFAALVSRLGKEHSVPTPVNDVLCQIIKAQEHEYLE